MTIGAGKGATGPGAGWVCLGAVTGAVGLKGEVRVKPFTEDPASLGQYGPVTLYPGGQEAKVTNVRPAKGGAVVRFAGVLDRNGAEALKGKRFYVPRSALPALEEEDEFYHQDLIGLGVEDTDGKPVGHVKAVHDFGAGDMLEIVPEGPTKAFVIAFTRADVPEVDIKGGRVVIRPRADEGEEESGEQEPGEQEKG